VIDFYGPCDVGGDAALSGHVSTIAYRRFWWWPHLAHDWDRAGAPQDRRAKPCLQHPPTGDVGTDGRRLTGGLRPPRPKTSAKRTHRCSQPTPSKKRTLDAGLSHNPGVQITGCLRLASGDTSQGPPAGGLFPVRPGGARLAIDPCYKEDTVYGRPLPYIGHLLDTESTTYNNKLKSFYN